MGKRTFFGVAAGVIAVGLIAAGCEVDSADVQADSAGAQVAVSPAAVAAEPVVSSSPSETPEPLPSESDPAEPEPEPASVTVVKVVDGDTVYLSDGGKVRLIGYDTPETGECGFDDAKAFVSSLVLDHQVEVVNPEEVDDVDAYDRELRYLSIDGDDLGTSVLEAGLGTARYDSLDGYDRHPLQDSYRDISDAVDHLCDTDQKAAPAPEPEPEPEPAVASEADEPWNQPGPDLDCGDIGHPVTITGEDYHRLDRDGDGVGCDA
jgi:endonuclease YncB( thermonuclease family)